MKKVYFTPVSVIVPIKGNDILTSSAEQMNYVLGSWEEE